MSHYLQVPTELLPYAGKLSATQLLIWADAWMFKKNTGKAYRTNAQLSEMLNVTERSVSRAVQELIRMGAITVQSNGRNRVIDPVPPRSPTAKAAGSVESGLINALQVKPRLKRGCNTLAP